MAAKKADALPPLSETLLPAEKGDVLELDELSSFVGCKLNARWVWIALCRQTRQIIAYFVGDRSAENAHALRERIPADYRCRATRSDWWLAYSEVFPRRTHRCTGKGASETCHVERWNGTLRQRATRPLCSQNPFLLQVRANARNHPASFRTSLQPFTRTVTTTHLPYEREGRHIFTFTEGAAMFKGLWRFYYGASDECIGLAELDDISTLLKAVP